MYTLKLLHNELRNSKLLHEGCKAFFEEDWSRWRENIVPYKEHKDHYEYWINLAGFKKENVEAVVHEGVVTVKAEKDGNTASHSFQLSDDADPNQEWHTTLEDGLLTIKVMKRKEALPKEIKIQ